MELLATCELLQEKKKLLFTQNEQNVNGSETEKIQTKLVDIDEYNTKVDTRLRHV